MSAPQVTDLILHRGPALLLERILEVSPTRCIASVRLEPGFLLGTRSYEALVPAFPVGLELEVEAEALFLDDSGPGAFTCEVRHKGETLARARLKAIETP